MHEDYGKALQSNEAVLVIIDIQEKLNKKTLEKQYLKYHQELRTLSL
jgi:hypothetical protein